MSKPPKKCMKCNKWAQTGSLYCLSHRSADGPPSPSLQQVPRGRRGRPQIKSLESRAEYKPIKFSETYLKSLKKKYPDLFK